MSKNIHKLRILVISAYIILNACSLPKNPGGTPTIEPVMRFTEAAATLAAQLTQHPQTLPTSTNQPILITNTSIGPTATFTMTPTNTIAPSSTPVPVPCNWAQFVGDITIPDGTIFTPGTKFTKTWRLKNIGTCTWTSDYDLVFVDGQGMNAHASYSLPKSISPGETVDLSIKLTAPNKTGTHKGFWQLRSTNGLLFGVGYYAQDSFWVEIKVLKPNNNYAYDFALNYCAANWRSAIGKLDCPDNNTSRQKGFVKLLEFPKLENRNENEPTLLTHPNQSASGWIAGIYPAFEVQAGDHFLAWVGCLEASDDCNVIFRLEYRIAGGEIQTLGEWHEKYDGSVTEIDLDLSGLDGYAVQFILKVLVNDLKARNPNAFWFVPHIAR
ncbi:MAG: NBR1-Ig-like domain-containing protein [Anaerolineae bacterium]|nr:NBR1-Ig-like domain-containing protein [Anaerolineae bacterium]